METASTSPCPSACFFTPLEKPKEGASACLLLEDGSLAGPSTCPRGHRRHGCSSEGALVLGRPARVPAGTHVGAAMSLTLPVCPSRKRQDAGGLGGEPPTPQQTSFPLTMSDGCLHLDFFLPFSLSFLKVSAPVLLLCNPLPVCLSPSPSTEPHPHVNGLVHISPRSDHPLQTQLALTSPSLPLLSAPTLSLTPTEADFSLL